MTIVNPFSYNERLNPKPTAKPEYGPQDTRALNSKELSSFIRTNFPKADLTSGTMLFALLKGKTNAQVEKAMPELQRLVDTYSDQLKKAVPNERIRTLLALKDDVNATLNGTASGTRPSTPSIEEKPPLVAGPPTKPNPNNTLNKEAEQFFEIKELLGGRSVGPMQSFGTTGNVSFQFDEAPPVFVRWSDRNCWVISDKYRGEGITINIDREKKTIELKDDKSGKKLTLPGNLNFAAVDGKLAITVIDPNTGRSTDVRTAFDLQQSQFQ